MLLPGRGCWGSIVGRVRTGPYPGNELAPVGQQRFTGRILDVKPLQQRCRVDTALPSELMRASAFWKAVTVDRSNFLENLVGLLESNGIRYCVIGGQGVNAYVEPLVSLDLDLVIAVDQLTEGEALLRTHFDVERFPHSLNVAAPESKLRVQVQTDPRYFAFVERAARREVLDIPLPVAALPDVLQGKIWAALDETHRPSKRRKDLLDIERILDQYPELRAAIPPEIAERIS
jgi:hypothetical protein